MAHRHHAVENASSRENGPSNMKYLHIHRFLKELRLYRSDGVNINLQKPSAILPITESFQRQTIEWMVYREKYNDLLKNDGSPFSGGIVVDAMEMGRAVEVVGCILENPAPLEFHRCQQIALEDWKDNNNFAPESSIVLSTSNYVPTLDSSETNTVVLCETVSKKAVDDTFHENVFKRRRVETPSDSTSVLCVVCGKDRRARRVHFEGKYFQNGLYLCGDCVNKSVNNNLRCKATLIIVLECNLTQWTDEIKRMAHLGLKSFVYCGVNCDCYVESSVCFNDYDIIITTYSHLEYEYHYMSKVDLKMKLRNEKKYVYSQSPLEFIKWWRICFDSYLEFSYAIPKVTSSLQCVHKWVTNKIIQTTLNNFYSTLKFLDISPFCGYEQFSLFINGNKNYVYSWFSNVVRHNLIDEVNIKLNIPKLTNEQHWLTYSLLEKLFYPDKYKNYIKKLCVTATSPCQRLNTQLKYVNWEELLPIMTPIIQLLKECVHPQHTVGNFKKLKKLSMVEILNENISLWNNNITRILRYNLILHNAIGKLYFDTSPKDAIQHYCTVINLSKQYKNEMFKLDTAQVFSAVCSMDKLSGKYPDVFLSTVSEEMKMDLKGLRKEYHKYYRCNKMIVYIRKMMGHYSNVKYKRITNSKTLIADWYNDVFELTDIPKHFFYKLQTELINYCVFGVTDIIYELKSRDNIFNILQNWLTDLESCRTSVLKSFTEIQKLSFRELLNSAYMCCLPDVIYLAYSEITGPPQRLCKLCETETYLKNYEVILFNFSYKSFRENIYEKSQKELLLTKLFDYGKSKIKDEKWLKNATNHMEILHLLKTEFKDIHLLWCQLNDAISKHNNVNSYKLKLINGNEQNILNNLLEPTVRVYGQPKIGYKRDIAIDFIFKLLKSNNLNRLLSESAKFRNALKTTIGTAKYLKSLKTINPTETCLICFNNGDYGWAVLLCGHIMCAKCVQAIYERSNNGFIKCPVCSVSFEMKDCTVLYREHNQANDELNVKYKGNFSIKIESITLKLMELIAENPNVKVLIFSIWYKSLLLLAETLKLNSINYEIMHKETTFKNILEKFKTNLKTNALLLPLSTTLEDFNAIEATRIFFMEPVINKAYEIQAINKIRRIGQTQPTFVHHFIIRDTIEEKITNLFANKSLDNWDDVTVSELAEVLK